MRGANLGIKLKGRRLKDYDPEDDRDADNSDSDESGSELEPQDAGREHYESVGKSKLRKPDAPVLGAKYGSVAVSRSVFQDDEENDPLATDDEADEDPFATANEDSHDTDASSLDEPDVGLNMDAAIDEDEEIDSDEALGESDVEKLKNFTFRGSKKNAISGNSTSSVDSEADSDISEGSESDEPSDVGSGDEAESMEDFEDEDFQSGPDESADPTGRRSELKTALDAQNKALATTLAQAVSDDIKKGEAVKQQYQNLDRILNSRMKMQKAVTASEQLTTSDGDAFGAAAEDALKETEEAATALLATIHALRKTMLDAQQPNSKKRKRPTTITSATSSSNIWSSLHSLESASAPLRKTTIDKWSSRVRGPEAVTSTTRPHHLGLDKSSQQDKLTAVLDTYILNEQSKLLPPPDDAETSAKRPLNYDDTPFYQSLLRDLIQSRSSASLSDQPANNLSFKLHPSGGAASGKKVVDTRASKGRKIRYTVHEKLQNFMAAEGDSWASGGAGGVEREWTEEGRREFFGSLMGGGRVLREHDESDDDDDDDDGRDNEGEALMLFSGR